MTTDSCPTVRPCFAFRRDGRGAAAIEFALVVPMLLMLYLGSTDLCLGITLHRKLQHAVSLMSDLTTRVNTITRADLEGVLDMGDMAVMPRAFGLSSAVISGIHIDGNGKATVAWSHARHTPAAPAGQSVQLPASLKDMRNTNIVKTLATYRYIPVGAFGFVNPFVMKQEVYATARVHDKVTCTDC